MTAIIARDRQFEPLSLPPWYDPANNRGDYFPVFQKQKPEDRDLPALAREWEKANRLLPVSQRPLRVAGLGIDLNNDFIYPNGTLVVGGRSGTGAVDDTRRAVEFFYRYANMVSKLFFSSDVHESLQIFFTPWWLDINGVHPAAYTEITADDVKRGIYRPNTALIRELSGKTDEWIQEYSMYYCRQVEKSGKYRLKMWPFHGLEGTWGGMLAGLANELRFSYGMVCGPQPPIEGKGTVPYTEHFSIFGAEVQTDHHGVLFPGAELNVRLLMKLLHEFDRLIVFGQAKSHCVKMSLDHLLAFILSFDSSFAKKVYILTDCMSSVVVPGVVDYTDETDAHFEKYAEAEMHLVQSTTSVEDWPDFML